ncbi:MAG: metallophosphoesterase family protein [Solirubrobacterales bacterium]
MSDLRLGQTAPAGAAAPRTVEMGDYRRVAFLGGIYSNYLALGEALRIARERKVDAVFALGDFGAFGPHPDRTLEVLRGQGVPAIQGNYEESLSSAAEDCHCGYTDPRDNHFAQISYDYTRDRTAAEHKRWMGTLPGHIRVTIGGRRVLLCHGSPRRINEFLWRSMTPEPFLRKLLRDFEADLVVSTHTGLHWSRFVEPGRGIVNCGALGRPANDGRTNVWFAIVEAGDEGLGAELVPVPYDHERLAAEMRIEGLPAEFVETIRTGWWTSCLEILPAKERAAGRY